MYGKTWITSQDAIDYLIDGDIQTARGSFFIDVATNKVWC